MSDDRGALGCWLATGVRLVYEAASVSGSSAALGSLAWQDEHTVGDSHEGTSGAGIARLTLLGAAELIQTFAALYRADGSPLTRGHLPLARAVQEHLGRVVWLCEPGSAIHGSGYVPTVHVADEWERRRHRAMLLLWEKDRDAARSFERDDPSGAGAQRSAAERDRLQALVATSAVALGEPTAPPGYAAFADKIVEASTTIFDATGQVAPRAPYDRLSQSAHGTLFGLLGDAHGDSAGVRFEQSDGDLRAIAESVGAWWYTASLLLGLYHGWPVHEPLEQFWKARPGTGLDSSES